MPYIRIEDVRDNNLTEKRLDSIVSQMELYTIVLIVTLFSIVFLIKIRDLKNKNYLLNSVRKKHN